MTRSTSASFRSRLGIGLAILLALGPASHLGVEATAASASATRWSADGRLDDWLDSDLAPYLRDVLSRHPRFSGQTLRFVSLRGERTSAQMDELTRSVVLRLRPALQKTPGIRLWQPPLLESRHRCAADDAPDYELAIEVLALDAGGHRIAVRALDVAQHEWVPGVGMEWRGELTRRQRVALASFDPRQDAPGARDNPYSERQADLLAQSLAQDIGTRLCGVAGAPVTVSLNADTAAPPVTAKVLRLLRHNLSAARDVIITNDNDEADLQLDLHLVAVDGDLHQIWVNSTAAHENLVLPKVSAQAYLRVAIESSAARTTMLPEPLPDAQPVAQETTAMTLASVQVIVPADTHDCADPNPWRFDRPLNAPGGRVPSQGCFALELTARDDVIVFLLGIDPQRGSQRLMPSACRTFGNTRSVLVRGERLRFPVAKNAQILALRAPGHAGSQHFLAVAASDDAAAARIKSEVSRWHDVCNTPRRTATDPRLTEHRLARLREVVAQLDGRAELQDIEIRYVNNRASVATHDVARRTHNE